MVKLEKLNFETKKQQYNFIATKMTALVSTEDDFIANMANGSKGNYAYTILELDEAVPAGTEEALLKIEGVIRVRTL